MITAIGWPNPGSRKKKVSVFAVVAPTVALTAIGQQVRELVKKINGLEEQRDALQRLLAAQQQPPPTAGAHESSPAGTALLPLQDQLLLKAGHRALTHS